MVCHTLGAPWNEISTFRDFNFSAFSAKFRMRFRQIRHRLTNLKIGNRATARRISCLETYGQPTPRNGSGKKSLRQLKHSANCEENFITKNRHNEPPAPTTISFRTEKIWGVIFGKNSRCKNSEESSHRFLENFSCFLFFRKIGSLKIFQKVFSHMSHRPDM